MLKNIDTVAGKTLRAIAMLCLVSLFFLLFINVLARTFQFAGFAWFDEVVQGLFAWMVFIGAAALWRERDHFVVTWLQDSLGDTRLAAVLRLMVTLLCLCFLLVMTYYGYRIWDRNTALTPILQLPSSLLYVVIPIAGAVMTVYSGRDLVISIVDIFNSNGDSNA